jgi:hypothetical protein
MQTSFERNIFINCPFDTDYIELLRPMIFTIVYLGFNPRIALENTDVSTPRLDKILTLIRDSKFSIHDLSRIKSSKKNEFARLNMPFELGIDFGSKEFSKKHNEKKFLVLSDEDHGYKRALSDFSGFDAQNHKNDPIIVVRILRDWIYEISDSPKLIQPLALWHKFLNDFLPFLIAKKMGAGYTTDEDLQTIFPIKEFIQTINEWKIISH